MTAGQVTASSGATLVLKGSLTTNASSTSATIAPKVDLNGAARNFAIADGAAASDLTLLASVENGSVVKSGAGTMTVGFLRLNDLTLQGGNIILAQNGGPAGVSVVNTMAINGPFRLDIKDNHLISHGVEVGSWNGTFYSAMTGLIASGRNGGVSGNWSGNGIVTSLTAATTSSLTSIGVATAQQVKGLTSATATAIWAGQTVIGSDTLVMYTYGGDANLDGKINVDDYGRIDFAVPLGIAGWSNGDFNYDGKINVDDYGIIDFNVGIQGPPFSTGGDTSSFLVAVPEPSMLAPLVLTIGGLVRRRRRHGRRCRRVRHHAEDGFACRGGGAGLR